MDMEEKLMNNPYYAKAIEYIQTHDLNALEPGKHITRCRYPRRKLSESSPAANADCLTAK